MSSETARLVTESFHRIAPRAEEVVELFYETMFARHPEVRAMFPADMRSQRGKLISALVLAVRSLNAPETLTPILEKLGATHDGYGVEAEHYPIVGESLLHAIAAHDEAFDEPTRDAWVEVYGFISATMQRGASLQRAVNTQGAAPAE